MREIGTIVDEKAARVLEDHLLTLGISTKLVPIPEGYRVWVHNEDRVDEARSVLDAFLQAPGDARYQAATREARAIRKKAEQVEAEFRGTVREVAEVWNAPFHKRAPLTAALLAVCVVVAFGTDLGERETRLKRLLTFSVQTVDQFDGRILIRDHGFENIRRGEIWRVVTPIFLHFGLIHLVLNLLALIGFGERVESRKGWKRMAVIALVAAVLGNIGQFFESGGGFGGMSGVLFALAGYVWAKGHADPEDGLSLHPNTAFLMVAWFLFGIVSKVDIPPDSGVPQVAFANVCHGVGLAVGIVFGLLRF